MKIKLSFVPVIVLLAFSLLTACTNRLISVTNTEIALGTYVKIQIITQRGNVASAENAISVAHENIRTYEGSFDYRKKDGALGLFNNGVLISEDDNDQLFKLIREALIYARLTEGYFDPTILPLIQLWGFDTSSPSLPAHEDVLKTFEQIGYRHIKITEKEITKPRWVKMDLSGIAKGKIVDLIRDQLHNNGFSDFLIDAGGDLYVSGKNLNRKQWRIAIQDPMHEDKFSGVIEKTDTAIVTSGDYENFFMQNGKKYSHLFNPNTGYPDSDCKSVTIITNDTAKADALATAVFAMGSSRGYRFLLDNDIEGFIIFESGEHEIESLSTPHFWD